MNIVNFNNGSKDINIITITLQRVLVLLIQSTLWKDHKESLYDDIGWENEKGILQRKIAVRYKVVIDGSILEQLNAFTVELYLSEPQLSESPIIWIVIRQFLKKKFKSYGISSAFRRVNTLHPAIINNVIGTVNTQITNTTKVIIATHNTKFTKLQREQHTHRDLSLIHI